MTVYNGFWVILLGIAIMYLSLGFSAARYIVVLDKDKGPDAWYWVCRVLVCIFWLPLLIISLIVIRVSK